MDAAIERLELLREADRTLLARIQAGMGITADLSRADVTLFCHYATGVLVVAQARPRSISSLYKTVAAGRTYTPLEQNLVWKALTEGTPGRIQRDLLPTGAPVVQEVHPIRNGDSHAIAAISVETNLIEHERQRHRAKIFQRALIWLQQMCWRGELVSSEKLSPFGEWDGIVFVDATRRITYMSGIATNLYRRVGYLDDLRGKPLDELATRDDSLVAEAIEKHSCLEEESEENGRYWVRKVVPVWSQPGISWPWRGRANEAGAFILVHDHTDARRKEQELKVKNALIQEVHHRVKNNLQTIAALLRMQARRAKEEETKQALGESVNRILSMAVIHEYLSREEGRAINIRDICNRLVSQMRMVASHPDQQIHLTVDGPNIYLLPQQATACALVTNELLLNAMEHGYSLEAEGAMAKAAKIQIKLEDHGDMVSVIVCDNGTGLPPDFNLDQSTSLGLQIVRTLVHDDLKGHFELRGNNGVAAVVTFPKAVRGGSE